MATINEQPKLTVYGYFRSSCSGRLRIALKFKNIDFDYIPVNIKDGFHLKDDYAKKNPSLNVPTLYIPGQSVPITQSVAALEYLEEAYPDAPALLPKDLMARAHVRGLVNIISSDVQPVTNMKVMKKVSPLGCDAGQWSRDFHGMGFEAFEAQIKNSAGKYCHGDEVTLADLCLAPAVWNAERWGLDMTPYPTIQKVYANASTLPAFKEGHWQNQVDCPESLR